MKYVYLFTAIIAEVIATSYMKESNGFSKLWPSVITMVGYLIAFYFLSLTLQHIPTGIAYAIWAGVGIVLISLVAWLWHGQSLDMPAVIGIAFIMTGVVIMNVFSKVSVH